MNIYIDESGTFSFDKKNQQHSISCVVALVVPKKLESDLFIAFEKWKSTISSNKKSINNEVKGAKLDENDFQSFLLILSLFDVLIEVDAIDLGLTADIEIENHKLSMAKSHAKSNAGRKTNARYGRDIIATLSNQNYVQILATSSLIYKVLKTSINYYVQRFPNELGEFQWIFDAKDPNKINEYEISLTQIVMPLVQTSCMDEPLFSIEEEDYTHLQKYIIDPENILEPFKSKSSKKSDFISITDIMNDMRFIQSHDNTGLQIVDILSNCVRRGMSGRLQFNGWKYLASLIIRQTNAILITRFGGIMEEKARTILANFINYFNDHGKQMCVPDHLSNNVSLKGYISWSHLDELPNVTPVKRTSYEYY